ncbi:MAG: homocitrate synthase, partial [Deltaproteobacteria bacterium]|nr:homocitrate synthase [Deltaproteobacteria bacterium]
MKGIVDSTLREGEQAAHVYLDLNEKLRIIELLIDVGIDEIELGIAQKNPEIKKLMKKAKKLDGCPKLGLWCRCLPHDIDETLALFPDILNLSIPVSDIHLKNRLGRDRDWIMRRVGESIRQAGNKTSCYLSLGLEDASRADTEFLEKVCLIAQEEGIDRVRFADTLGIMDPLTMANTITRL